MQDIFLLEPASSYKKRYFGQKLMSIGVENIPTLEDVKLQLREIRHFSISHREKLIEKFISTMNQKDNLDLTVAVSVDQAVNTIKKISGGDSLVINRSAVIASELKPGLLHEGMTVLESYHDEFKPFENRFQDFKMLPKLEFDAIWHSFSRPENLSHSRREQARAQGYERYVGLLGVNAASAEEGAIVFLQHMHNIRSIVTQAEKIILVVALDKVVRCYHDAVFQTKCMATFGAESLPLTFQKPEKGMVSLKNVPISETTRQSNTIHLILLDNGRSRILNTENRDLLACIGCRACLRVCPASGFFSQDTRLSPRDYIYSFLSGSIQSVDQCIQCKSCRTACPLGIDIPAFIREARINRSRRNRPVADHLLANAELFERIGATAPNVSKVISDNSVLRWFGEKLAGISRKRNIPKMQRIHLERWLEESGDIDADNNQ